jgi:DNA-binding response OmpR family regulator
MGRERILVVDDDARFLRFVTEVLTGAGYDVQGSRDPLIAAELAQAFRPDLAILDISMPGKDGMELAKELRASDTTSGIPLMFLTASRASEEIEDAKDSGVSAYLEKPVKSSNLLGMVRTLLEGETGRYRRSTPG